MEIKDNKVVFTDSEKQQIIRDFKSEIKKLGLIQRKTIEKMLKACKEIRFNIEIKGEKLLITAIVYMPDGSIAFNQSFDFIKAAKNKGYLDKDKIKELKSRILELQEGVNDTFSINQNNAL